MSLIEQLGGYNIAKTEFNMPIKLLNNIDYDKLGLELLEYRRQNGIFEVGDLVFDTSNEPCSEILKIDVIKSNYISAVADGIDCTFSLTAKWTVDKYIRHCTTKEISQGYRDE